MNNIRSNRHNPESLVQILGREIISFYWLAKLAECIHRPPRGHLATIREPAREGSQNKGKQGQGWILIPDDTMYVYGFGHTLSQNLLDEQIKSLFWLSRFELF